MTAFYRNKKVAVTGAAGFIARHLIDALIISGAEVRGIDIAVRPDDYPEEAQFIRADLMNPDECGEVFRRMDYVFHLAAVGWGFHENLKRQPQVLTDNLLLNTTALDSASKTGVKGYLLTSSAAVYPAHPELMEEDAPWDKPPHGSEKYYAWSKRMAEIQAKAYYEHYGFPVAIVRLFNPYGPGDNFDAEKSHVIPALIRRALEGENPFTVWGTGKPLRSFIHARDAARGMMLALEKMSDCRAVNLGSPEATSIVELVKVILELTGRSKVEIIYDRAKPEGHPRRLPDTKRMQEELGLRDLIPLKEGLRETIDWYRSIINNKVLSLSEI